MIFRNDFLPLLPRSEMLMRSLFVILFFLYMVVSNALRAQIWSKQDSLKLANILAGKDSLKLNPEFRQSIQEGTFINTNPVGKMREHQPDVPFTKDFSEYIRLDKSALNELRHPINELPPQAAMREPIHVEEPKLKINPLIYRVPRAVLQGTNSSGYDFNHLLSYLFSPSYRQKIKNAQRNTWRIYNDIPALRIHEKQKEYRKAHPEMIQE